MRLRVRNDRGMSAPLPFPTSPGSVRATVPQVVGHRGARAWLVENTAPSFAAALDAGVDAIELDVLLSRDGVPVVWHDPVLPAEKLGPRSAHLAGTRLLDLDATDLFEADVASVTLPEFPDQRPARGGRIAPLYDQLEAILDHAAGAWVLLELKAEPGRPGLAATAAEVTAATLDVLALLDAGRPDLRATRRVLVESFDWAVLAESAARAPYLPTAALAVPPGPGVHSPTVYPGSPWLGPVDLAAHGGDVLAAVAATGARAITPLFAWLLTPADLTTAEVTGAHGTAPGGPAGDAPADMAHLARDPSFARRALATARDRVRTAHDRGLAVIPWTVNDPAVARLLLEAGVDGLVGDDPGLLLSARGAATR